MYAYLTVFTAPRDRVCFPDGREMVVEASTGATVADAWVANASPRDAEAHAPEVARQIEAFQAEAADWQAELDRRSENAFTITRLRAIREEFERERPQPVSPVPGATESEDPAVPTVESVSWWMMRGPQPDTVEPLAESQGEIPRSEIAARLSELELHGWTVVHVSEDRVVGHTQASSRAVVVGCSILVRRAETVKAPVSRNVSG